MNNLTRNLLYWTPRGFTIAFAIFLSLFAVDVFSEHLPFGRLLIALATHLVPTFVLLALLALSWKWEWLGVCFIGLGLYYYIWMVHGRHLLLALPAFVIGLLFLVNWLWRSEITPPDS